MKKRIAMMLLGLAFPLLLAGGGLVKAEQGEAAKTAMTAQIANPWMAWNSIEEAELAAGFSFGLPEVIADSYTADEVRTMNNELIEVVYHDEAFEICVRKKVGEGQDISGDYNTYETCTEESGDSYTMTSYHNSENSAVRHVISYQGCSWSLVAPNGYRENTFEDFLNCILQE